MRVSKPLKISPTPYKPFKPSRLAIPPSPCSPLSPITTIIRNTSKPDLSSDSTSNSSTSTRSVAENPSHPLAWLWRCHICRKSYRLSVTRRCLSDGHHFCSGMSTCQINWRPTRGIRKKGTCPSEFDYIGWAKYAEWRRGEDSMMASPAFGGRSNGGTGQTGNQLEKRNCWEMCDYPSQCRWGKLVPVSPSDAVSAALDQMQGSVRQGDDISSSTSHATSIPGTNSASLNTGADLLDDGDVSGAPATNFDDILKKIEDQFGPAATTTRELETWTDVLGLEPYIEAFRKKNGGRSAISPPSSHGPSGSSTQSAVVEEQSTQSYQHAVTASDSIPEPAPAFTSDKASLGYNLRRTTSLPSVPLKEYLARQKKWIKTPSPPQSPDDLQIPQPTYQSGSAPEEEAVNETDAERKDESSAAFTSMDDLVQKVKSGKRLKKGGWKIQ